MDLHFLEEKRLLQVNLSFLFTMFQQSDGVMGLVGERRVHVYSSDGYTILGIMGKDATADAPYKGFRFSCVH